jgi:hypothetical protein
MKFVSYLCIALLLAPFAEGQNATRGTWESVRSITPGRKVQVYGFGPERFDGQFGSASADSITVTSKSGERTVPRSGIREIKLRKPSGRMKNAGISAAVGGGIGGGVGLAITGGHVDGLEGALVLFLAGLGAVAGFAGGSIPAGYGTVYKAQQP